MTSEETRSLLALAESRLNLASSEKLRDQIPQEERDLYRWLLAVTDDREKSRSIFSRTSMEKLAELRDGSAWVSWLKKEFERAEAEAREAAEAELKRSPAKPGTSRKNKWKLRLRILSASHSIRPKALRAWNEKCDWLKLVAVPEKKKHLIIELILPDSVPVTALWYFGWGVARHFVVALNIGTMGFWWWHLPEHVSRYYESIEDLERHQQIGLDRTPSLKVDWGANRVLTEEDLVSVASCFMAIPDPSSERVDALYNYYIGGLTFLSLNDVHWQCEDQAFGNFFESLRCMMAAAGEWSRDTPFEPAFNRFLDEWIPAFDEREKMGALLRAFEAGAIKDVVITLKEVSFLKLFCDAYFMKKIRPIGIASALARRQGVEKKNGDDSTKQPSVGNAEASEARGRSASSPADEG